MDAAPSAKAEHSSPAVSLRYSGQYCHHVDIYWSAACVTCFLTKSQVLA